MWIRCDGDPSRHNQRWIWNLIWNQLSWPLLFNDASSWCSHFIEAFSRGRTACFVAAVWGKFRWLLCQVNVSSSAHKLGDVNWTDINYTTPGSYVNLSALLHFANWMMRMQDKMKAYGSSKTAIILSTSVRSNGQIWCAFCLCVRQELARRFQSSGLTALSLHPVCEMIDSFVVALSLNYWSLHRGR